MTTQLMPPPTPVQRRSAEPTVREIISTARTAKAASGGAWLIGAVSAGLLWASFTPLDWGPLAWIALVPLAMLVRLRQPTRRMTLALYGGGLLFWLPTLQWMRLGHPAMYVGWFALAFYLAAYVPVSVWLSRVAVQRLRIPLVVAFPAVWVGLEFARAHLLTGFPWYFLGHTQYRWLELIQISDVTGAYGVSFVVAMSSAVLAGLVPERVFHALKLLPTGTEIGDPALRQPSGAHAPRSRQFASVAIVVTVTVAVVAYGFVRRGQAPWTQPDAKPGPRIALVQGNFPTEVKHDPQQWLEMLRTHDRLTGLAVPQQPDVIVWPETMFRWPLFDAAPGLTDEQLRSASPFPLDDVQAADWIQRFRKSDARERLLDDSRKAGAAMIVGIETYSADERGLDRYNSALFVQPQGAIGGRYDKLHRVIFGEYVPLKDSLPFLQAFSPFPPGFDLAKGETAAAFETGPWRLAPIICFEDTVPHLVRGIVRATRDPETGRPVDCLVNLTNDGWFHGSSELDQHLVTAAFRSVELRTPMVRAVNTGISAFIDGDGAIVEPEVFLDGDGQGRTTSTDPRTGRRHKQLNATLVHTVPLDGRTSLYLRWGDWFPVGCLTIVAAAFATACVPRRRTPAASDAPTAAIAAG